MVLQDMYARERVLSHLEWLLALEHRYDHVLQTGLIHIAYDPAEVLGLTFDAADAANQLSHVLGCLKQSFRSTDLVARDGFSIWILTPFTQFDPIMEKVQHVIANAPKNGLSIAKKNISVYLLRDHLNADTPLFERPEQFLSHLLAHRVPVTLA